MNVNIGDVFVDFSTPIIARVKKYIDNKITFQMILELCETKKVENKQEEEKKEEKDDKKKYFWNIKEITIKNKENNDLENKTHQNIIFLGKIFFVLIQ